MTRKIHVYVGCALTHAPESYKKDIKLFKKELKKYPWIKVLEFLGPKKIRESKISHAKRVYKKDIKDCVGTCHAMIGELSLPSLGLGYELGTLIEKHRLRTLMCAKKGSKVSNLPYGAPLHIDNPHASFKWYRISILELLPYFIQELELLHAEIK